MLEKYDESLRLVLIHEGVFSNDPQDPGGATLHGITQGTYNAYRRNRGLPVRALSPNMANSAEWLRERAEIYRLQYWNIIKGDQLPPGIDYVVFDGAVNSGPSQSVKWLQRSLGFTGKDVDGVLGERTLGAIERVSNHDALIAKILDRRMAFLKSLRTFSRFGRGWTSRVNGVRRTAQAWARGDVGPAIHASSGSGARARLEDAHTIPSTAAGDMATGGGVASGGVGEVVRQAQGSLEPLAASSDAIAKVVAALVISGVVLTAGGLAYRWWARRRAGKLADALDIEVPV